MQEVQFYLPILDLNAKNQTIGTADSLNAIFINATFEAKIVNIYGCCHRPPQLRAATHVLYSKYFFIVIQNHDQYEILIFY